MRKVRDSIGSAASIPGTQAEAAWGDRAVAALPEPARRRMHAAARTIRHLSPAGPLLATAIVLLLLLFGFYGRLHNTYVLGPHAVLDYIDIGSRFASHIGLQQQALNRTGYDGQFNYYLGLHPDLIVTCAHDSATCPLDDLRLVRVERILFPMTARLVALGQPQLLPYALLLVNFAAILVIVWLVGSLAVAAGASRWLGAAAGLYAGNVIGFLRDLSDPFSVMWVVVAIYLLCKNRPLLAALAVGAALLSREQLLFYLPFLALPLVAERRWRVLATSAAIALGPFVTWQLVLRVLYGSFPLIAGDSGAARLVLIPFQGLWQERFRPDFGLTVLCVVVPLVLAVSIALMAFWEQGPRGLLRDPLPIMVVLYSMLLSFTYWFQWADVRAPSRLAAPALVLALLIAARQRAPALRASYATLLAVTALAPLILIIA